MSFRCARPAVAVFTACAGVVLATGSLSPSPAGARVVDTTLAVKRAQRLDVNNFGGAIRVQGWGRDAVRIRVAESPRGRIEIAETGHALAVRAHSRYGMPARASYLITVPAWMAIDLSGVNTEITVDGVKGGIKAVTVKGDVVVRRSAGDLVLSSVEGDVRLEGVRGTIHAASVNQGVSVSDAVGQLAVQTVNGDIALADVVSDGVEATTVNGDIVYDGSIRGRGEYRFATHNGDISVAVPSGVGATVTVSSFSGDFASVFPVRLTGTKKGKTFDFVLGDGRAHLELESFQGTIELRRPGDRAGTAEVGRRSVERSERRIERRTRAYEKAFEKAFKKQKSRTHEDPHEDHEDEEGEVDEP